jgi:hypothetical protein
MAFVTDRQTSEKTFYSPHDGGLSDAHELRGFFLPSGTNGLRELEKKKAALYIKARIHDIIK